MNKTTKGSLAAGAAAVLLLGGAGSLAYWTGEANVNGGSITAGTLSLVSDGPCDGWTHVSDATAAGDSIGEPVTLFVPGDIVTNTCTFTVGATGDNLEALISATDAEFTAVDGNSLTLVPATTYEIAKGAASRAVDTDDTITSVDDGAVITATIDVTIPFGSEGNGSDVGAENENDTQSIEAALESINIKLTQVNPNV